MNTSARQRSLWAIGDTIVIIAAIVPVLWIASLSFKDSSTITEATFYAIARLRFPGKGLLIGATLLIAMFPAISLVSPLFNLWRQLGLFDTWPGLIIPYLTFSLPLGIYTLSAFFREIPWELEKAAQVDGASPFQAFIQVIAQVIAPLAAPGMVTTAILVFASRSCAPA